jgi:hypothetical protein
MYCARLLSALCCCRCQVYWLPDVLCASTVGSVLLSMSGILTDSCTVHVLLPTEPGSVLLQM